MIIYEITERIRRRFRNAVSRDPVPELETQSLEVWYRIPSQPYEDCFGLWEYIVSFYTAVISGLFSQYFDEIFRSATAQSFSCCFSRLYRISQKPLCSLYIT